MNKNIAINVLTWNDWKNTIVCLESIFNSEYENFDIILIDNNSEESHLEKIYQWSKNEIKISDQEFSFNKNKKIDIKEVNITSKISKIGKREIYLIKNQTNLGLTAGLNVGYKFSIKQNYDYVARIDCDFIISKNYIKIMIDSLEKNKDVIAMSPKIKHAFLRHTVWWSGVKFHWSFLKFQRTMNLKKKRIPDNENFKGIKETDAISGCCSIYRSNSLELCGYGDESFFFGPEDIELSYRLKKFGKLLVNLDAYTLHKIATSSNVSGWYKRSYDETVGFLLLIKKIGSKLDKIIGYSYFILRIPYFLLLLIIKKREKDRVFGFCLGCFDFFIKNKYNRFNK